MPQILEARAIITGDDRASADLRQGREVAESIGKAGKAVNASMAAGTSAMAQKVEQLSASLKKVQDFRDLHSGLVKTRTAFVQAQAEVVRLGRRWRRPASRRRHWRATTTRRSAPCRRRRSIRGAEGRGVRIARRNGRRRRLRPQPGRGRGRSTPEARADECSAPAADAVAPDLAAPPPGGPGRTPRPRRARRPGVEAEAAAVPSGGRGRGRPAGGGSLSGPGVAASHLGVMGERE